jgi:ketosteroid isomerase-like protein
MTRHTRLLASAIALLLCSLAMAQTTGKMARSGTMEAALEKRFREYADALTKRDTAMLEKIWADDYVFINPRGELVTKAQRLDNVKTGKTEFKAIDPQQEQIRVHGNVAVDVGRVRLEGTRYSGQESSGDYRYMNVWVKQGNEWRMAANQITLIQK